MDSIGRGRGARGLLLQRALQAQQQAPGEPEGAKKDPTGVPASEVPRPGFLGRGTLGRGLMVQSQTESPAPGEVVSQASAPPKLGGGLGRGLLGRGLMSKTPTPAPAAPQVDVAEAPASTPTQQKPVSLGRGLGRAGLLSRTPTATVSPASSQASLSTNATTRPDRERPHPNGGAGDGPMRRRRETIDRVGPENKRGKIGIEIPLSANYIKMTCKQSMIYQYHVEFFPSIDSRHMRMKMFYDLADPALGMREARAFDGRILYLPIQLPGKEQVFPTKRPTDGLPVNMRVIFTNETPLVSCPAVYNIIFKKIQSCLKMVRVNRNFFSPSLKVEVPAQKLEVWPGYVTSVCNFEGGLLLMCDVTHKVIRQDTVYDQIFEIQQRCPNTEKLQSECARLLIGQNVLTRYNNRTYRIDDIAWTMNVGHTFERAGEEVSFLRYFRDAYNITVQDKSQPLLLSKPRRSEGPRIHDKQAPPPDRHVCLVPELCYMTGLTDDMRADFHLMRSLHAHTRVTPGVRHKSMLKFIENVRGTSEAKSILAHWGMDLETDTVDLLGRRFQPEKIRFGGGGECSAGDNADFKREIARKKVISAIPVNNWLIVCTDRDSPRAREFAEQMKRRGQNMGIIFGNPVVKTIPNDRTESYVRVLKESIHKDLQLVVAVFPQAREDRYNAFKKICCVEHPIPSQAVVTRTISDPNKLGSVAVNIALQINVKLGGELWAVKVPIDKFMCVGIDVYHEGKGRKGRSVGGIVGSMNSLCTRWYSRCAFQQEGQEMIDSLSACFGDMLKKYYDENNFLPEVIFFYRDGVGDGMMGEVQKHEVPQLMNACKIFGANYKPRVVFLVVQKRINTRLFVRSQGSMVNPNPGTVMDHSVTRANVYDFFLVPQSVRQGTVTPSHFVVLYDSTVYRADQVQVMAFKMCHMYYNWPGTVRVPAPCLYAHKLAYLVGQNLRQEPSQALIDRLFYL